MSDDFVIRKSVPLGRDQTLEVRGLSFVDIGALIQTNLPAIVRAVAQYNDATSALYSRKSMDDFLSTVALEFPQLAAQVIALASDRSDVDFTKLTGGRTIVCLLAIGELTLEDMGDLADPSPALANVIRRAMAGAVQKGLKSASPGSTGA